MPLYDVSNVPSNGFTRYLKIKPRPSRPAIMDEQEFRDRADESLNNLYRRLLAASGEHGFDADFNSGALAIEFEAPPAKFVVSPNTPVRQIWVSAHSKSFKLDWDPDAGEFVLPGDGRSLKKLLADLAGEQLGEPVDL